MVPFLTALYADFFADPLYFIGIIFALWGAMGFGFFMAGFADGVPHLFNYSESDEHMKHSRERIVQGLFLSMTALGGWEVVRFIDGQVPWGYLVLSLFLLLPIWLPLLRGKKGAH
jgi:hypothetical protein